MEADWEAGTGAVPPAGQAPGAAREPAVAAVSGVKNSGKTTLIEGMLPLLAAAGLRVAVIKHDAHTFRPDVPGTDSFRHRAAGAVGTAVFDREKSMVIRQGAVTERHLIAQLRDSADLILLEGFKDSFWPKLELVRAGISAAPVCKRDTLLALLTDLPISLPGVPTLPIDPGPAAQVLIDYWKRQNGEERMEPFTPPASEAAAPVPASGAFRAAVVTASDSAYAGTQADLSGPEAVRRLTEGGYQVVSTALLPHDRAMLAAELTRLCDGRLADLVVTIGGDGLSPYDCAPEATLDVAERAVPGISEAMRYALFQRSPTAMFSRGTAGVRRGTLIINLPGEPEIMAQCLEFLLPSLPHGLNSLRGGAL